MASGHGLRSVLAGRDSWFGTGRIRWAGRRRCVAEFLHGLTILRAEEDFAFAGFGIHAAYLELGRVLILIFLSCLSFLSHRLCRLFRALGLDALELLVGLEIGALQAALELRHTAENGSLRFGGWFLGIALGFENFGAHQFPLSDGGLVDQVLLSRVLGLVLVLEAGVELVKLVLLFAGNHDLSRAQAVA